MRLNNFCFGVAGLIAAGLLPATVQAAPISGSELKAGTAAASNIEKAAYRRCWWRHGYRVCRWVGYPYYDDDYGYYGPSFGFRFGDGGHRFHGHHR
jgi:hypothetical protein